MAQVSHSVKRDERISNQDDIMNQNFQEDGPKQLFLVIKGDVHGTVEALRLSLNKLKNDECEVNILRAGVGPVTDSDIDLAHDSKGMLVAFNTILANLALSCDTIASGREVNKYYLVDQAVSSMNRELYDQCT